MYEYRRVETITGNISVIKTLSRGEARRGNEELVNQARRLGINDTTFTYYGLAGKISQAIRRGAVAPAPVLMLPYYMVSKTGEIKKFEAPKAEREVALENGAVKTLEQAKILSLARKPVSFRTISPLGEIVTMTGTMKELNTEMERLLSIAERMGLDISGRERFLVDDIARVLKQSPSFGFSLRRGREGQYVYENLNPPNDPIGLWLEISTTPALYRQQFQYMGAMVLIQLKGQFEDGGIITKTFLSRPLEKFATFETEIENYLSMPQRGSGSRITIIALVVTFIPKPMGGCGTDAHHKFVNYKLSDGSKLKNPTAKNNNCFFRCFDVKETNGKLTDVRCNEIRKMYGLAENTMVPSDVAVRIASDVFGLNVVIMNSESLIMEGRHNGEGDVCLFLVDGHYMRLSVKLKYCSKCQASYYGKHTSCRSGRLFKDHKKTGTRWVMPKSKMDEKENVNKFILHYDIETTPKNERKEHVPYIVGFAWYDVNEVLKYETIEGEGCMDRFYLRLCGSEFSHIRFINAYNGANFDHFYLVGAMLKASPKKPKIGLHNGSLTTGEVAGKKLVDVAKHLGGSLKANLEGMKCTVSKGDVNHNLTDLWEKMNEKMKADILEYLKSDVKGLVELSEKYNNGLYEKYKINFTSFVSLSAMTYPIWNSKYLKEDVALPTNDQEALFRKAVYGGRCYKNKHRFLSSQWEALLKGEITEDQLTDYVTDLDVVSLYPTAMMSEFPIGKPESVNEWQEGKMGIYYVKYVPPTNLLTPILPRRDEKGSLHWDLFPGHGAYTSVDIENARKYGYKVEVMNGWVWNETAKVLESYILDMFQAKQNSEKGTAQYAMAKLMMNGLYGKMIQRPIHKQTAWIDKLEDFWAVLHENDICEMNRVGERLVIQYEPRDQKKREENITKPTQLGAFILSYSRRIMLNHMDKLDCAQTEGKVFYYTDTDSLQVHADCAKHIKMSSALGELSDDVGGKIVRAGWIQPKFYFLDYLKKTEKVKKTDQVIHTLPHGWSIVRHNRAKGLHSSVVTDEVFQELDQGKVVEIEADENDENNKFFQMRRVHIKQNSKQKEAGISNFSVVHVYPKKTIQREVWKGRNFTSENSSVPWGYAV